MEEHSKFGAHMVNAVIDGLIDWPTNPVLSEPEAEPDIVMTPVKIAGVKIVGVKIAGAVDSRYTWDRSCWRCPPQLAPLSTEASG
jgi:hypothetical protein